MMININVPPEFPINNIDTLYQLAVLFIQLNWLD